MSSKHDESQTDLIRGKHVAAFDVWALPSFDPFVPEPEPEPEPEPPQMEEVPLDEVQPLTLEELEAIRQEASPRVKKKVFTAPRSRFARKPKRRWRRSLPVLSN